MAEVHRTEVHKEGGSGGIYAILVIIVVLIIGIALYFSGVIGPRGDSGATIDVNIEAPLPGGGEGGGGTGGGGTGG